MTSSGTTKEGPDRPSFDISIMTESIQQLELRQALYRFFAALFLYPEEERMTKLCASAEVLHTNAQQWDSYPYADKLSTLLLAVKDLDARDQKTVVDEYNRLFLVKPLAPPYETYYRSEGGQFDGQIAAEVSGRYANAGLTMDPDLNELPDHVAVELEYLSFLCGKELEATQAEDHTVVEISQGWQREFIIEHLARWFPAFAKEAREAAQGKLYPAALAASYSFLRSELAFYEIPSKGN